MSERENITTSYKIDLSDFKKGINEIGRNIKLANAQFKATSAGMDDWKSSTEGLQAKLKQLQTVLENEVSKLKIHKTELKEVEAVERENAKRAEELKSKLKELAEQGISKTSDEYKKYEKALSNVEKEQRRNKDAAEKLRITVLNQQGTVNKTTKEMRNYKSRLDELENTSKQLDEASDEVSDGFRSIGNSAKKTSDDVKDLDEGFTVLKGAAADLMSEGIKKLVGGFKDFGKELIDNEKAIYRFQSRTGSSAEEMKKFKNVMQELYSENFGESISDIADSMSIVVQTSKEVDPTKIKELTKNAILMRDTFDFDVSESIRAANMMVEQFGLSGEEAFNLIAQGAQKGLNKNGDLLDVINEYSVHYEQLGLSSEDFFNSLANGAADGTFSVDKLGDAVKEFGIRVKDTAESTTEGFQLIGLNADTMRSRFAAGGESAKKAMQETVNALFKVEDEVKRNQAGVDLFGTMWEDLGQDAIRSLTDINGNIKTTNDSLKTIETNSVQDLGSQFSALGRDIQNDLVYPIGNELMPVLKGVTKEAIPPLKDAISFMIKNAKPLGSGVLGIATAWGTYKAAQKASNTITAVTTALMKLSTASVKANTTATVANVTATKGATVATKALSAAQKLTGWGLVAGLIGGVVIGLTSYAIATRKANEKTYANVEATKKLVEEQKALNDSLTDSANSRKEAQESAETQAATAEVLFNKIQELNEVEEKSAAQKETMKKMVSDLNEVMPELNLKYDAEKDALNQSTDAIKRNISAQKDLILAKAAQENLASIAQDIAKLEIENSKLTKQHAENEKILAEATRKRIEAQKNGSKDFLKFADEEAAAKTACEESSEALKKNTKALKERNNEYKETSNYSERMVDHHELQEKLNALTETCLKAGVKIPEAVSEGIKSGAYAIPKSVDGMKELISFHSLENKAKQSGIKIPDSLAKGISDGSVAPSKAIEKLDTLISFGNMLKKSHLAGVEIPESISEGIISGKLSPQMAIEQMEILVNFNDLLEKSGLAGVEVPKEIEAGILSGKLPLEEAIEEINKVMSDEMDKMPEKAASAGNRTGYSYTEGVRVYTSSAYQAGSDIGLSSVRGEKSGSSGSLSAGSKASENYVTGFGENSTAAYEIGSGIADDSIEGVESKISSMYTAGLNVAAGLLSGVLDGSNSLSGFMSTIVTQMLIAFNKKAEIKSPARAFSRQSKFIPFGIKKGIDDNKHVVIDSLKNLMNESLKSSENVGNNFVRSTISNLKRKTSDLKNGFMSVGEMKSRLSNVGGRIKNNVPANFTDRNKSEIKSGTQIYYNQYISSPKATDRMEIRRQTKNTLRMIGGKT